MAKNATATLDLSALPGPDNIQRVVLENGLRVLVRENFTTQTVVLDGTIFCGSIYEPGEQAGLANFASSALMRGSERYDFDQIYETIENAGASLSTGSNVNTAGFGGRALAEDLETLLALAAEVLRHPTFPGDHIERLRSEMLTALAMREHNTRARSSLAFFEMLYGLDHPYGYDNGGTHETISAITRDDLLAFHKQTYGPREGIITIVGGVAADKAIELVQRYFGDWQNRGQPERIQMDAFARPPEARKQFIPIAGKSQSDIVLGWPGPRRKDRGYQAARIGNSIFGTFGMYGRLGAVIREEHGLAYYSYSGMSGGLGPGAWKINAGVNPANVDKAIELARQEVRRFTSEPVTAEELSDNKAYIIGRLPLQLETNGGQAGSISNIELYDLGLDYLQRYPDVIMAITRDEIQAVAEQYLHPDEYVLAVAGPELETEA